MAINLGSPLAGLGSALGTGIGGGINQSLDMLAQQKMMELQANMQAKQQAQLAAQQQAAARAERAQYARGLEPLLGSEVSSFLSNLGPAERKAALQNIGSLMQLSGAPQQEEPGILNYLAPGQTSTFQEGRLSGLTGPNNEAVQPGEGQLGMSQAPQNQRSKLIEDIFTTPAEKRAKEALALRKETLSQSERHHGENLSFKREQAEEQKTRAAFKETKPERKEIQESASAARDNLARLNRMEELNKKNDLNNPVYLEALRKFGLDIEALKTPDTQEFNKLTMDFLRDAKNIFGARVTNYDVQAFLKAIPSLSQSKEGRERVINNLKIFNQAAIERSKASSEVLKSNKGTPPLDFIEKVEEKAAPKIDALYKKMSLANIRVGTNIADISNTSEIPVGTRTKSGKEWNGQRWIQK